VCGRGILKGRVGKPMTTKKQYKRFESAPIRFPIFGYEIRIAKIKKEWKYEKKNKEEKPLAIQEKLAL
jgi:hypothetical protein